MRRGNHINLVDWLILNNQQYRKIFCRQQKELQLKT